MKTKSASPVLTPNHTPPLPQTNPNDRYSTGILARPFPHCTGMTLAGVRTIEQNDGLGRLSIKEQLVAFSSMHLQHLPVWQRNCGVE